MFVPTLFRECDTGRMHQLMQSYGFATLVTVQEGVPFVSLLPFLLDTGRGEYGTLKAHLARANPQWEHLAQGQETLVVFQGPHAYVSPTWYAHHPAVPTWNYAVVHAWGVPRLLDATETLAVLRETTDTYESRPKWTYDSLPDEYLRKMGGGVVGFELPIARLDGKFKLSQNRPVDDQARVAEALAGGEPLARETARLMRENAEARE